VICFDKIFEYLQDLRLIIMLQKVFSLPLKVISCEKEDEKEAKAVK
jgi:hypothetical protein